ncbi:peptidase domain-containing ABC transporter [Lysobacter soli]|uniref:peptidase domain-containing ABC transporter n=1 Tax=Lysobacter soli TaxID=453783 RepID=UPI00240F0A39|nr:peptidase domain-containing ABC transporter [Lysobacter soli]MDG2517329.1 peptidase domain-containing ABC transporter [Lysobacter soli]
MIGSLFLPRARLPMVQQAELAECGLACLAMIGQYHGHDIDLAALRRRFPVSIKGATLSQLIDVAMKLGLSSRALRVEIEYLGQLATPCILHWDMNHFVVLHRVERGFVEIHDPAMGVRRLSRQELETSFTGVALELTPTSGFAPVRERTPVSIRTLVGNLRGVSGVATQVFALALALEAMVLAAPLSMQFILDRVLTAADHSLLALVGIGFLTLTVFQAVTIGLRGWIVASAGASIGAQWTTNLFGHLLRLPLTFFEKRSVGEVMTRFHSVQVIQHTLTGAFIDALLDGVTVLLVLAVLLVYSPTLTLLVLATLLVYAVARWAVYRHVRRLHDERLACLARQQGLMLESIQGAMSLKLANRRAQRHARLANLSNELAHRDAAIQRVTALFGALSKGLSGLQRIVLLWIGAWLAMRGGFTAGMMIVFVAYADMFAQRAGLLIDRWIDLRMLGLHAVRIADIALEQPERHADTGYVGPPVRPSIEVEGLGFRYSEQDAWVLRGCSLRIEPGESLALVGPSGCGKTTLAKLLLGLLEPTEGVVRIGGIDIQRYGLEAYRDLFGTVMQDDKLFAGSIAANIAFFDADADLAGIERAARMAQVHDDIVAMPMGYETLVGDMGSALSGGQRQRVLLARALYRQPSVMLLDEATSHLDAAREQAINEAVSGLAMTRILIAHRPSTIASADRVVRIEAGALVEEPGRRRTPASGICAENELTDLGEAFA